MPPVLHHVLSNGLGVHIIPRHDLPIVDVRVVVRAGAALDDPGLAGRACLTADLLDEGTTSRGALDIADEVEHLGASMATRASWDHASAELHVLAPRLQPALQLLADVLIRPAFPQREVERRRTQRLNAILQERAEPRILAAQTFARLLYGAGHPFGTPVGGTRDTVTALGREHLVSWYERCFTAGNAFVVAVGDVRADDLLRDLQALFGEWRSGATLSSAPPASQSATEPAIHVIDRPGAPQSEIRIGHAGPSRTHEDYIPLQVANTVLGGAFTSRLNMLLREQKAYTYGAGSSFAFRAAGGPFLASTAVFTDVTADAVQSMVSEIGRMAQEPVPDEELDRARRYITLGLPRTFETTADLAEHATETVLYGLGPDYYDRYAGRIRGVGSEQVQAVAERWMRRQDLVVVIAGDASRIVAELETLGLGAVHVREGD